jgi:hypothetical protein
VDAEDRDRVIEGLELLLRCEEAVGDFYRSCAATWPIDRGFWSGIAEEEAIHVARLGLLRERVVERAAVARVEQAVPCAALNALFQAATRDRELLLAGKIGRAMAFALARDLERSLIGSRGLRAIAFAKGEWDGYLRTIVAETHRHERLFEERLAQEFAKGQEP